MNTLTKLAIIVATIGALSLIKGLTEYQVKASATQQTASSIVSNGLVNTNNVDNKQHIQQVNLHYPTNQPDVNTDDDSKFVTNIYQTTEGNFYFQAANLKSLDDTESAGSTPSTVTPLYFKAQKRDSQFDVNITGPIVRTNVTQKFKNTSNHWLNGVYVFPLPEDAAVDSLKMVIGDRIIEGEIKQKEEAKRLFEKAKASGKRASLVSQLRPNIFKNEVSNIPPLTEITVYIEYQQLLLPTQSGYELRLPTSINPRYISQPDLPLKNTESNANGEDMLDTHDPHLTHTSNTLIRVNLDMGLPLKNITSLHHKIIMDELTSTHYRIQNKEEHVANDAFVLRWQTASQAHTQVSHFQENTPDGTYGLISMLAPTQAPLQIKRDVTFILDTSGSMVGEAMEQAKQALNYAIEDLSAVDNFNIVEFDSDANALWGTSYKASDANKLQATRFVNKLQADGGTEMLSALSLAFELQSYAPNDDTRLTQFIFITDGSIGNEAALLEKIHASLGNTRLFTVGIGPAPNEYFMQEAATVGKGTYTYIGDTARVNSEMKKILNKIKQPALTDLHASIVKNNARLAEVADIEIFPEVIPDLYVGEPLHVFYRVPNANSQTEASLPIQITGKQGSVSAIGNFEFIPWTRVLQKETLDAQLDKRTPGKRNVSKNGIDKQWAYEKIRQLTRRLHTSPKSGKDYENVKKYTRDKVTALALKHSLVSDYTSLIAIDKTPADMQATNNLRNQAKALSKLVKTASPSRMLNWWGAFLSLVGALGIAFLANPNLLQTKLTAVKA